MESLTIFCLSITSIVLTILLDKLKKHRFFKLIKEVGLGAQNNLTSINFNGTNVKLNLVTEDLTPKGFDYLYKKILSYTLFVNDNPVISVWVLKTSKITFEIIENEKYNIEKLHKLLRAYKKENKKAWKKDFDEYNQKNCKKSMF